MSAVGQNWGTQANALTTEMNSLGTSTYSSAGSSIDLADPGPLALVLEAVVAGANASNSAYTRFFALWSDDNSVFSDAESATLHNAEEVGSIHVIGTGGNNRIWQIPVRARYVKFMGLNSDSTHALASTGNTLAYTPVFGDIT